MTQRVLNVCKSRVEFSTIGRGRVILPARALIGALFEPATKGFCLLFGRLRRR